MVVSHHRQLAWTCGVAPLGLLESWSGTQELQTLWSGLPGTLPEVAEWCSRNYVLSHEVVPQRSCPDLLSGLADGEILEWSRLRGKSAEDEGGYLMPARWPSA